MQLLLFSSNNSNHSRSLHRSNGRMLVCINFPPQFRPSPERAPLLLDWFKRYSRGWLLILLGGGGSGYAFSGRMPGSYTLKGMNYILFLHQIALYNPFLHYLARARCGRPVWQISRLPWDTDMIYRSTSDGSKAYAILNIYGWQFLLRAELSSRSCPLFRRYVVCPNMNLSNFDHPIEASSASHKSYTIL